MEILKYKGAGPAEVMLPWGERVRRGGTIHVPDEMAEELVRDRPDDWEFDQVTAVVAAEETTAEEEED